MVALVGFAWIVLCTAIFGNLSILLVGSAGLILLEFSVRKEPAALKKRMTAAFSVSMVLMLVQYFGLEAMYGEPYYRGGSDDMLFERYARYLIEHDVYTLGGMLEHSLFRSHNSRGFVLLLSWLMRLCDALGGYHTVLARILNLQLLQGIGVMVYRYYRRVIGGAKEDALRAYSFLAFFPNAVFVSAFVFRDTLNMFLLFAVFLSWNTSWRKNSAGKAYTVLLTVIASAAGYWLRAQNVFIIGAIVLISLVLQSERISGRRTLRIALLGVLIVAAVSAFGLWDMASTISERYNANYRLRSESALSRVVFATPLLPFGIFLRLAYAIVSPIPVPILQTLSMFGSAQVLMDVLVAYGTAGQVLMLPYMVKNLKKIDGVTVLFAILWGMIACTTFTFRHFLMLYPLMAIMISRTWAETSKARRKKNLAIMLALLAAGAAVYLMIS